jgi:hypothetical protein
MIKSDASAKAARAPKRKARKAKPKAERAPKRKERKPKAERKAATPKQLAARKKFSERAKSGEFKRKKS